MKFVVISPEESVKDEIEIIVNFFEMGMQGFHLRKPGYSEVEMESFIEKLPEKFHNKVILHSHHQLIKQYNLGGIHFTKKHLQGIGSRMKNFDQSFRPKQDKTISASFHSMPEVEQNAGIYNYLFLSPVFNSISKENYRAGFDLEELKLFLKRIKNEQANPSSAEIFALGGIKTDNIQQVFETGFDGVAIYGTLWAQKDSSRIIKTFEKLIQDCNLYTIVAN